MSATDDNPFALSLGDDEKPLPKPAKTAKAQAAVDEPPVGPTKADVDEAEAAKIATASAPVEVPAKRKRRTKAEIAADEAAKATAASPVTLSVDQAKLPVTAHSGDVVGTVRTHAGRAIAEIGQVGWVGPPQLSLLAAELDDLAAVIADLKAQISA